MNSQGMIKRSTVLLAIMASTCLLFGCIGGSDIDTVKNGVLDLDRSATIGNVLDNYAYITSPKWSSFEDQQKRKTVQFEATLNQVKIVSSQVFRNDKPIMQKFIDDKNSVLYTDKWSLLIRFMILQDKKIKFDYIGFKNDKGEVEDEASGMYMGLYVLKNIYRNEAVVPQKMIKPLYAK